MVATDAVINSHGLACAFSIYAYKKEPQDISGETVAEEFNEMVQAEAELLVCNVLLEACFENI
jgi:hypothetical protein